MSANEGPTVQVLGGDGVSAGEMTLPAGIFGIEPSAAAMHSAVVTHWDRRAQHTKRVKTRGEVRGSTAKMFRQKGTGRARMGSVRSPVRVGGGVAHGPHGLHRVKRLSPKVRKLAARSALSVRAREGAVVVVADLDFAEPRTKRMVELLGAWGVGRRRAILYLEEGQPNVVKSARNLPNVRTALATGASAYDVLMHELVIFTRSGLASLDARLGAP
jgi:large subunit ribosomal protein L4